MPPQSFGLRALGRRDAWARAEAGARQMPAVLRLRPGAARRPLAGAKRCAHGAAREVDAGIVLDEFLGNDLGRDRRLGFRGRFVDSDRRRVVAEMRRHLPASGAAGDGWKGTSKATCAPCA